MRAVWPVLVGVAVLCGCADAGTGAGAGGVDVRDSAGVRIVVNHVTGEDVPLGVEEVSRIGVVEGEEPYLLSRVLHVAVAPDDCIFVANGATQSVRMYDPAGRFVREFGRRGKGPGEVTGLFRVFPTRTAVALLSIGADNRLVSFDRSGALLETRSLARPGGVTQIVLHRVPAGWIGFVDRPENYPRNLATGVAWEFPHAVHRILPSSDTIGGVVVTMPATRMWGTRGGETLTAPFLAWSNPEVDSVGDIFVADRDAYRIEVWDGNGALREVVTRDVARIPLTDAEVDRFADLVAAHMDTAQLPPAVNRREQKQKAVARVRVRAGLPDRPAFLPVLGGLLVARDGSFWVRRVDRLDPALREFLENRELLSAAYPGGEPWDVFDGDGRFVTAVRLPQRFQPWSVHANEVTGVLKDELDVEYVVTYRVREQGRER